MGEWIPASIRFGGKLPRSKLPELIELLDKNGLTTEWDCGVSAGELGDDLLLLGEEWTSTQVNYGDLSQLCKFAVENGLHYLHWFGSSLEWNEGTVRYNPDICEELEAVGGANSSPAITESYVRYLGSYEAVLKYFAKLKEPLPPLEIVE